MNISYNSIPDAAQKSTLEPNGLTTNITVVKPTISIESLPLSVWENIANQSDTNTLLKFRLANKAIYFNTSRKIIGNFCHKRAFNNYSAYSMETYNKFIKPKLLAISPTLINTIEYYLEQLCGQDDFRAQFAKFLFYKMHHINKISPQSFATITKIRLHDQKVKNSYDPDYIKFFNLSHCGNYCITVNNMNIVTLFAVSIGFQLKKLYVVKFPEKIWVEAIEFTSENNLCIVNGESYKLALWQPNINTKENKYSVTKIAELALAELILKKAIVRCNDTKLILLMQTIHTSSSTLELWQRFDNQFIKKWQLDKSIIEIPSIFCPAKHIEHTAINADANILAISVGKELTSRHIVCFLAINSKCQLLTQEKINGYDQMFIKEMEECDVKNNLQLTPSGDMCAFINYFRNITGMKRSNNSWHKIFTITNGLYYGIQLMPYEENLITYRGYFNKYSPKSYTDIEIYSFIKKNNFNMAEGISSKMIKPKKYRNYFWQKDADVGDLYVHPTGLSVFKFNSAEQHIDIITMKPPTKLDTAVRIAKIVWQHR